MNAPRLSLPALLLAVAAAAEPPAVNFDQGVDPSAILAAAGASAEKVAAPVAAAYPGSRRYDTDCVSVTFGPNDGLESRRFHLESREWVEECYQTGDPRHGGGRQCHTRPGYSYRETAQVKLRERLPLLPWESDTFRVCLTGPWLDISEVETAYDYALVQGGGYGGAFVVAPGKKTPMRPDPVGVLGELDGSLRATFKDRWASYYSGETVEIKYSLKKSVEGWFDTVVKEGSFTAAVADSYALDLSRTPGLQAGKKYYLEYRVKRVGAVSKPVFTRALETGKASYAPALLALAR
jgi:hypothetical protein